MVNILLVNSDAINRHKIDYIFIFKVNILLSNFKDFSTQPEYKNVYEWVHKYQVINISNSEVLVYQKYKDNKKSNQSSNNSSQNILLDSFIQVATSKK